MKRFFPRIMWADVDTTASRVPVAVYCTKADQRGNRPDLTPVPVAVISLAGRTEGEFIMAARDAYALWRRHPSFKEPAI